MADLFNEKSQDWDSREVVQTLSSAVGSAILKHVPLNEQMHVMDFGAGTGLISSQVVHFVKKIVAVDTSESMLNKLVKKPELEHKVTIVCQDIIEKNLTEKFDLIMSAMAMHHVEDTEKLFQRPNILYMGQQNWIVALKSILPSLPMMLESSGTF